MSKSDSFLFPDYLTWLFGGPHHLTWFSHLWLLARGQMHPYFTFLTEASTATWDHMCLHPGTLPPISSWASGTDLRHTAAHGFTRAHGLSLGHRNAHGTPSLPQLSPALHQRASALPMFPAEAQHLAPRLDMKLFCKSPLFLTALLGCPHIPCDSPVDVYNSLVFSIFSELSSLYHDLILEPFHHPTRKPMPISVHSPFLPTP